MIVVNAVGAALTVAATVTVGAVALLRRISDSVGLAAPTLKMLQEENPKVHCPLVRHLPELETTLAWRSLGAVEKSPVHICRVPSLSSSGGTTRELEILVKREDLLSPLYGGNKVRTLQHQLAVW
jgi:hypothetical protein